MSNEFIKNTSIISSLSTVSVKIKSGLNPRRSFTSTRSMTSIESGVESSARHYTHHRDLRTSRVI